MSLFAGLSLLGLVVLVKATTQRREARRAEEQARTRADLDRMLAGEREAGRAETAAAFADPQPPTAEEAAEFGAALGDLGLTLQKEDGPALARAFDAERMFDELLGIRAFDKVAGLGPRGMGPEGRAGFARGFRESGAKNVFANPLFRWQRTDVRRVRWSPDRNEAVVIATHVNETEANGRLKMKVRWWFVRHPGGWRIYDFEELDQGLRLTAVMGSHMTADVPTRVPALKAAVAGIRDARGALFQRDIEAAEEALSRCRDAALPDPVTAVVCLMEAILCSQRGEPAAALEFLDRAVRLNPDMPVVDYLRADCFLAMGQNEKARAAVEAYAAQLGADDEVGMMRGAALEGLNRLPAAKAAYRKAHDLDPDAFAALVALRRVLAPDELKELGERLARATDPRKVYDEVWRHSREEANPAAADALLDALRKARPDDLRAMGDDIRRQVRADKFNEAEALMTQGPKAATREARVNALDSYLFAMLGAKKLGDAYAAVPADHAAHAFRTLADELDDEYFDRGDGAPDVRLAQLKEVVAVHRKRVPGDVWLFFYQGAILQHEKEYEKAADAFATGAAKLPKAKAGDADEPDDGPDNAQRFRWRRVECMFRAEQGLEAYEKVQPTADVFQQLAGLYDRGDDFDGLAALLAAHRKREPNDVQTAYWQGHLSFRQKDYATATLLYKKFLRETDEKVLNRWSACDEYVRGTLRTRPKDAAVVLAEVGADKVGHGLRAAVAAATGDRPELERLLAETTTRGGKVWFYHDEDFRKAIGQERWRDLRTKYPDPNPPPELDG